MDKTISMSQIIRRLKDELIQRYYHFRIQTIENPYRIRLRKQPYKILFLLGHMRSGSSLFTHILNSNPEIIGYGETHLNYESERDFNNLMFKVYWQIRDYQMNHKYLLDKVLHNHKILDINLLHSENLTSIFLIREPQITLASILDIKPHFTEKKALYYYCERLSMLEKYGKIINSKERSLLVSHDQLLNHTDSVFATLKTFLDTKEVFSEQYNILRTTGMKGIGDSSKNIKAGRIIRNPKKSENKISQDLVEKGMQSFNKCHSTLSEYCRTVEI
ncbi:MAG: sulfotransferase [Moorea sp. SIO2B7]|nr:sulfotransferase [Moorena sp. SIO2B7]